MISCQPHPQLCSGTFSYAKNRQLGVFFLERLQQLNEVCFAGVIYKALILWTAGLMIVMTKTPHIRCNDLVATCGQKAAQSFVSAAVQGCTVYGHDYSLQ